MGSFSNFTRFSSRNHYRIVLDVTSSYESSTSTKVTFTATAKKTAYSNTTGTVSNDSPFSSGSPRSFNIPNGTFSDGSAGATPPTSQTNNWSFSFTGGSSTNFVEQSQPIWTSITRYVNTSNSISVTASASHSLLGSASVTISIPHVRRTTFDANGGSVSPSSIDADNNSSITLPTPTRSGYTFNGWFTAASGGTFVGSGGGSSTVTTTRTIYAQWTLQSTTYTISYNANGGTGTTNSTSTTSANSSVDLSVASNGFSRTGYTFQGWNTSSNGSGTWYYPGNTLTLTSSSPTITLYAQWGLNTFTLSYNGNGASGGSTSNTTWSYPTGSGTVRSNGFSRDGYNFIGWGTTSSSTTASYQPGDTYFSSTDTSGGSATLYAVWQIATVTPNWGTGDTTITTTAILNTPYENTATDRTVSATVSSGSVSYTLLAPTSGTSALSWLGINPSTGQLSGTPIAQGQYRFRVRATSSTNTTADTSDLTITVIPAGQRITSSTDEVPLQWAKRFIGIGQTTTNAQGQLISADAQGYVLLTRMQRWNGSSWENI